LVLGVSDSSASAGRTHRPTGLIGLGRHSAEYGNELIAVSQHGRVREIAGGEITGFSWSPTGTQVVLSRIEGEERPQPAFLGIADCFHDPINPVGLEPVGQHTASERDMQPAWSPDGQLIAFSRQDLAAGTATIDTIRPNGNGHRQLTSTDGAYDFDPQWSPDGERLAFIRDLAGDQDLVVVDRDGKHEVLLSRNGSTRGGFSWAPDSRQLVFARTGATTGDLFTIRPDGSRFRQLTTDGHRKFTPRWSPDGSTIAFTQGADLELDLYALRLDTSEFRRLTNASGREISPSWAPDSRFLAYLHFPPGFSGNAIEETGELRVLTIASAASDLLATGAFNTFPIAWQPSGESSAREVEPNSDRPRAAAPCRAGSRLVDGKPR
jgi:Tol biopolymer transport system component